VTALLHSLHILEKREGKSAFSGCVVNYISVPDQALMRDGLCFEELWEKVTLIALKVLYIGERFFRMVLTLRSVGSFKRTFWEQKENYPLKML